MSGDRFFKDWRGSCHVVPAGRRPEDCGIDTRMAIELPRLPREHERYVAGRFFLVRSSAERAEREARANTIGPVQLLDMIEALQDRLALLEAHVWPDLAPKSTE